MLQRNDVSRHLRRYFIDKEKELRAISHLPQQTEFFKGLLLSSINGHEFYHYKTILERASYSTRSGSSRRRHAYGGHFVQVGRDWYIT